MLKEKIEISAQQAQELEQAYKNGDFNTFINTIKEATRTFSYDYLPEKLDTISSGFECFRERVSQDVENFLFETHANAEDMQADRSLVEKNIEYFKNNRKPEFIEESKYMEEDMNLFELYSNKFAQNYNWALNFRYECNNSTKDGDLFFFKTEKEVARHLVNLYDINLKLNIEKGSDENSYNG